MSVPSSPSRPSNNVPMSVSRTTASCVQATGRPKPRGAKRAQSAVSYTHLDAGDTLERLKRFAIEGVDVAVGVEIRERALECAQQGLLALAAQR